MAGTGFEFTKYPLAKGLHAGRIPSVRIRFHGRNVLASESHECFGFPNSTKNLYRTQVKALAKRRQSHFSCGSIKKLMVQLFFEPANAVADT